MSHGYKEHRSEGYIIIYSYNTELPMFSIAAICCLHTICQSHIVSPSQGQPGA
jgi:hypothetical protein